MPSANEWQSVVSDLWYMYAACRLPEAGRGEDLGMLADEFLGVMQAIGIDVGKKFGVDQAWLICEWHLERHKRTREEPETRNPKDAVSDLWYSFAEVAYPRTVCGRIVSGMSDDLRVAAESFLSQLQQIGVDLWEKFEIDEDWLIIEWHARHRSDEVG